MVRDAVVVALIALVAFQGMRRYVGDYYRVPSGSMEPFLHGDASDGDVVWVDAWSSPADRGRGDVVVVQHPGDPGGQLVKRIAALGDEAGACVIDLRDGDVWLGDNPQRLTREVKDVAAARDMRVRWAAWPAGAAAGEPLGPAGAFGDADRLVVPPLPHDAESLRDVCRDRSEARQRSGSPIPRGFVGTSRAVDATYLDVAGRRGREGDDVQVRDAGLGLRVLEPVDGLAAILETREETFTFHWQPAAGRVELWRDGVDVGSAELPVRPAGAHRVELGRLDGQLFFVVDGRADATLLVPPRAEWTSPRSSLPRGPRTRLFVAALGERELAIGRLEVFRDVYYFRDRVVGLPGPDQRWPVTVPKGEWFLLGDNPFDSRDSRQFGPQPAAGYLGRPRFVLGPWPRSRWLLP